jgi:hypothetical protein
MPNQQNKRAESPPHGDERTPEKSQGQINTPQVRPKRAMAAPANRKCQQVSAAKNGGLQDDHDPNDIGQRTANKPEQGIVRDERGQEQPADKKRAQQPDSKKEQSQMERPAAYAPHEESEKNSR